MTIARAHRRVILPDPLVSLCDGLRAETFLLGEGMHDRESRTNIGPRNLGLLGGRRGVCDWAAICPGAAVQQMTIDGLKLPACHLLKIDVAGMEADVLAGAEQTIRRWRPVLYVENDRPEKSAALIRQALGLGYRLYWHLPRLFNPHNYFGVTENIFGTIVSVNMLGFHGSISQNVTDLREITDPEDRLEDPGADAQFVLYYRSVCSVPILAIRCEKRPAASPQPKSGTRGGELDRASGSEEWRVAKEEWPVASEAGDRKPEAREKRQTKPIGIGH